MGFSSRERLNTLIHDIVKNSYDKDDIVMSELVSQAMSDLRAFMFERVYTNPLCQNVKKARQNAFFIELYEHYLKHIDVLPLEFIRFANE